MNLVVLGPKFTDQFPGEGLVFLFETKLPWNDDQTVVCPSGGFQEISGCIAPGGCHDKSIDSSGQCSLFNQLNDLCSIGFSRFLKIDDFFFHNSPSKIRILTAFDPNQALSQTGRRISSEQRIGEPAIMRQWQKRPAMFWLLE
jgi:hypothetical protein